MKILLMILLFAVPQARDEGKDLRKSPGKEGQEAGRALKKKSDYEIIIKKNIFGPPRATPRKPTVKPPVRDPQPKVDKPKPPPPPWEITGVFYQEDEDAYRVIVEKKDELRVLKAGDELEGVKVVSVSLKKIEFLLGEETQERSVGEDFPRKPGEESSKTEEKTEEKKVEKKVEKTAETGEKKGEGTESDEERMKRLLEERKKRFNKKPIEEPPPDD